jgi:hypothetical protein
MEHIMSSQNQILIQHIHEQIALEEQLCKIIEKQISEINEPNYIDAKNLLIRAFKTLESQFAPLNSILDKLEDASSIDIFKTESNGIEMKNLLDPEQKNSIISRILRDDYSALNLITMSNTLLHTTALALESKEVAELALQHIKNLAPVVIKIGQMVPDVVTRELKIKSPLIDLNIAKTALKNTQQAWKENK